MKRYLAILFVAVAALASAVVPQGLGLRNVATVASTASASRPLDSFASNLRVAYSVPRRLLTSYTGALFRVRRSSDSAEQDIGAGADGWADTAALASFVGAGAGDVVKIYDQAGGGYTLNASPAAMSCVVSGTAVTLGGRLAMTQTGGLGSAGYQSDAFTSYTGTTLSCFARGQIKGTTGYARYIGVITSGAGIDITAGHAALIIADSGGVGFVSYTSAGPLGNAVNPTANTNTLISAIADGTNLKLRDGTTTGTAAHSASWGIDALLLGNYTVSTAYADQDSKYAETILWTSDQTASEAAIRAALTY